MDMYAAEAYTKALYTSWIEDSSHYLFAAYDTHRREQLAGYVLAGPCDLPLHEVNSLSSRDASPLPYAHPHAHPQAAARFIGQIKRLYLAPPYHGTGMASQLLLSAVDWLHAHESHTSSLKQAETEAETYTDKDILEPRKRTTAVYLGVYPGNERAIQFYQKHNFEIVGGYNFSMGTCDDPEHIMRLKTTWE